MKKYRLWDHYEEYGLVGEYDTEEEAEDTDGECQVIIYRFVSPVKGFEVVTH